MERHENKRKIALEIYPSFVSIPLPSLPSVRRIRRRMVKLNLRLKSLTFRRSSEFGCAGEDELVDKRSSIQTTASSSSTSSIPPPISRRQSVVSFISTLSKTRGVGGNPKSTIRPSRIPIAPAKPKVDASESLRRYAFI